MVESGLCQEAASRNLVQATSKKALITGESVNRTESCNLGLWGLGYQELD